MFEEQNPTDRARLLRTSKKIAEDSFHSHTNDRSSLHTHSPNPAHTNSRNNISEKLRGDTAVSRSHHKLFATEGVDYTDPAVPLILNGRRRKNNELIDVRNSI